jgi:hypothetical protein
MEAREQYSLCINIVCHKLWGVAKLLHKKYRKSKSHHIYGMA